MEATTGLASSVAGASAGLELSSAGAASGTVSVLGSAGLDSSSALGSDFTALLGLRKRPPSLFLGFASPSSLSESPFFLPKLPKKEVRRLSLVAAGVSAGVSAGAVSLAASTSGAAVTLSGSMGLPDSSTGLSS